MINIKNAVYSVTDLDWGQSLDLDSTREFTSRFNFVRGWGFRGHCNVEKHAVAIRKYFEPAIQYKDNADAFLKNIQDGGRLVVGVHIRHGDYERFLGGKYFYSLHQYAKIMEKTAGLFLDKRVSFCLCSNISWSNEIFSKFDVTKGPGEAIEDMYVLAGCHYVIGPPSTFTIWASFYGNTPLYQIEDPDKVFGLEDFKVMKTL